MKKTTQIQSTLGWRITLRPGMAPASSRQVKVFTSPMAFDGYVNTLRALGVIVSFSSPFVATCEQDAR